MAFNMVTIECLQREWELKVNSLTVAVSYCVRVSPSMANRMVDSVRSVLNQLLPDVYIYTDAAKGGDAGR